MGEWEELETRNWKLVSNGESEKKAPIEKGLTEKGLCGTTPTCAKTG
jgi:hypothetical protein